MKTPVFHRCLKLLGCFDCVGILYSNIHVDKNFRAAEIHLWRFRDPKMHFVTHEKLFVIIIIFKFHSFFSSKPSTIVAGVDNSLWVITSYILFVVVHLYLGLLEIIPACEFRWHRRFLYIARHHFIVYMIAVHKTPYLICYGYMMATQSWAELDFC